MDGGGGVKQPGPRKLLAVFEQLAQLDAGRPAGAEVQQGRGTQHQRHAPHAQPGAARLRPVESPRGPDQKGAG